MTTMTTTPPTVEGWYWVQRAGYAKPTVVFVEVVNDTELWAWNSLYSRNGNPLSDSIFHDAQWSVDPITPPSDTALSLSEQYLHAVDAALQISETIAFKSPTALCDGEATADEKALAWRISMAIKGVDRAEVVKHVLSLLAESPDNPGAPVDMGDGDE